MTKSRVNSLIGKYYHFDQLLTFLNQNNTAGSARIINEAFAEQDIVLVVAICTPSNVSLLLETRQMPLKFHPHPYEFRRKVYILFFKNS